MLLKLPSLPLLACLAAVSIGGYWIYWELTIGRQRRQLIRRHGCKPPRRVKKWDLFLGLDGLFNSSKWLKQHTLLENLRRLWFPSGSTSTVESRILFECIVVTAEPENMKAVFSGNFRSFGQATKTKEVDFLLGDGIFNIEGDAWHQSRELLRPIFARSQVADLHAFETHVRTLIERIPGDGSTVDLSNLFSQLTLSTSIDFIFDGIDGQGNADSEITSNDDFATVWNRLSSYLVGDGKRPALWVLHYIMDWFRLNPGFRRDGRILHGKYRFSHSKGSTDTSLSPHHSVCCRSSGMVS
jgi:cytochrome P450